MNIFNVIKGLKNIVTIILGIVVGAISILVAVISIKMGVEEYTFRQNAVPVTAVIEEFKVYRANRSDEYYRPHVSYTYNGVEYEDIELDYYNSDMHKGMQIEILCNPDKPEDIGIEAENGYIFPIIMFVVSIIMLLAFTARLLAIFKKSKLKNSMADMLMIVIGILFLITGIYMFFINIMRANEGTESMGGVAAIGDIFIVILFVPIGAALLIVPIKKICKRKNLRTNGRHIYAIVKNIDLNYNYSENKVHPYVIYCYYEEEYTGKKYFFKSDNLWNDPSSTFPIGSKIPVYVDNSDFTKYVVDTDEFTG